ncbi:MAG TPA: hypothetical protein VFP22_02370 [Candidatus Limnocylindrales bacterium]|nr:hypothetical protein [Candidatus Limnocylindrales bacterium]
MRRWVCIIALLAGFAGDDYVRGARLRPAVAVERLLVATTHDERSRDGERWTRTGAWWARSGS